MLVTVDSVPGLIAAISLAVLFAIGGAQKWRSLGNFERTLQAYELFPAALVRPVAIGVAALEWLVAAGLLVSASRRGASLIGAGLLAAYALAIGVNLRRGRRQIDCGCAGFGRRREISGSLVWRNVGLGAVLLAVGWLPWKSRDPGWIDIATIAAGVCVAVLLYLSFDRLLGLSETESARAARARA